MLFPAIFQGDKIDRIDRPFLLVYSFVWFDLAPLPGTILAHDTRDTQTAYTDGLHNALLYAAIARYLSRFNPFYLSLLYPLSYLYPNIIPNNVYYLVLIWCATMPYVRPLQTTNRLTLSYYYIYPRYTAPGLQNLRSKFWAICPYLINKYNQLKIQFDNSSSKPKSKAHLTFIIKIKTIIQSTKFPPKTLPNLKPYLPYYPPKNLPFYT